MERRSHRIIGKNPAGSPETPPLRRGVSYNVISSVQATTAQSTQVQPAQARPVSTQPGMQMRVNLGQLDTARKQLKSVDSLETLVLNESSAPSLGIEAPEKKGMLWLQAGETSWAQRWCALKEGYLYIFETAKSASPSEAISLSGGVIKERPDVEQNCFSVTTPDKRFWVLHADEEYDYFTWIVALRGVTVYLRIAGPNQPGPKLPLLVVKPSTTSSTPRTFATPAPVKGIPTPTLAPPKTTDVAKLARPVSTSGLYEPIEGGKPPRPVSTQGFFGQKLTPSTTGTGTRATKFFGSHRRHSAPELPPLPSGKTKGGYLTVPEGKLFTAWKPRWVVLEGDSLFVFNSEEDEPKKELALQVVEVTFCNAKVVKSTQSKYIFEVMTSAKTITFAASTGAEMLEWISAIQEAQATLMGQYLQYDVLSSTSTTTSNSLEDQVTSDLAKSKQMLNRVLRVAGNERCADCSAPDILWASINLGVFLCINCSGVHRSMGVHISKVRSVTMDKWEPTTIQFMETAGNTLVNSSLEHSFPTGHAKIPPHAPMSEREKYIRNKYEAKLFAKPS